MFIASYIAAGKYEDAARLLESALKECVWTIPNQFQTMLGWCEFCLAISAIRLGCSKPDIEKLDDRLRQERLTLAGVVQLQGGEAAIGRTLLTRVVKTQEDVILALRNEALADEGGITTASILRLIAAA